MKRYPVIIVAGATATGKTAASVELARLINAEIISADSRQVYRCLDIGTAKPTTAEMKGKIALMFTILSLNLAEYPLLNVH